jgi:hypothetical protein
MVTLIPEMYATRRVKGTALAGLIRSVSGVRPVRTKDWEFPGRERGFGPFSFCPPHGSFFLLKAFLLAD